MRVLFLANSSWYLKNFRSSTLKRFSDFSDVWCLHPFENNKEDLKFLGVQQEDFYMNPAGVGYWGEIRSFFSLFMNIRRIQPDVVFSFNPKTNLYALVACFLIRIACFPNVSGVGVASQLAGLRGFLYKKLCSFFYFRAKGVFFQNGSDLEDFVNLGWVALGNAKTVPGSGVNLNDYLPRFEVREDKIRFLLAARLIKQKGVLEFCEAARIVKSRRDDCEFLLAGVPDFSARAVERSRIDEYADAVSFLGHVTDMPSLLKEVDCSVLPSYYPEGIPRSLIEAAAAGKLIITTDMPGCRDVIDGNGIIVSPRSIESLVSAFEEVADMKPTYRLELMMRSRILAESKYDENIVINRYVEVLTQL
jgi:glycosyltransferase involved in cell wall biosynthesis